MATTYSVYFGVEPGVLALVESGVEDFEIPMPQALEYNVVYYWRVDTVVDGETATGNEWYFTSIAYDPPLPTGMSLTDVEGEEGEPTGTPTGENNMITIRKLVAAAHNKLWVEDI